MKEATRSLTSLVVLGALLSVVLVLWGEYHALFGTWMCLFGLVHVPYRRSLPASNYMVGVFYIISGAVCMLHPGVTFVNPWPMGLVFFAGETAGGIVLYRNRMKESSS